MFRCGNKGNLSLFPQKAIEKRIKSEKVDLILHIGDIAYNMFEEDGKATDSWMNMVEPYAAQGRF